MTTTTPHGEVESWTAAAACGGARRSVDPDAMFVRGAAQRDARQVCFACVVRTTCLVEALEAGMEFGVWGGMTERERRQWLRDHPGVTSWRTLLERAKEEHEDGRVGAAPRQRGTVVHDSRARGARAS